MAKCLHKAGWKTIELLLRRIDPANITKEILIRAIRNPKKYGSDCVRRCVAEKCFHIPITTEILVPAAQYGSTTLFRFLWHRRRISSVPRELINAAAKNVTSSDDHTTFSFLFHEVNYVEIGEETLIAIAANLGKSCDLFDLLLEQGLKADTVEGLPDTLLMNGGIKVKCSIPSPLQLSNGLKVTETMFEVASSRRNKRFLAKLSKFCELERTPEKWVDIARLYNAVAYEDIDLLKTLLGRGVEPDVADPDGQTPLVMAAWWYNQEAVQMLLSAGESPDGGPKVKSSPLCLAAYFGLYDMVKILVNAGASIDFRDDEGQTPSMLAKSRRYILIFKYLEQSRMQQERAERQTPEST